MKMKVIGYYTLTALFFLIGIGLLILTNNGVVHLGKPYARRLPIDLGDKLPMVAFEHVTVIPMDNERILADQTVIVQNGIISQIGDSEGVDVPAGAVRIDGNGRYLMPGLVDMHVHVREESELLLFVANGVTTVRNLWGGTGTLRLMGFPDHLEMRKEIENNALLGPTLYTSGPIMEGPPPRMPLMPVFANVEEATQSVEWQINQGYDFIKVYDNMELDIYEATIQAASQRGVQVVGHTPRQVRLDNVLSSGQVTIEHLTGYIDPDTAEFTIREEKLPQYGELTREAGVWLCPTIGIYQMHVPDEELHLLLDREEMAYVSPTNKFLWKNLNRPGAMKSISYKGDYPARINEIYLKAARILHEGGARFILGTDSNNPYVVPGFSLLDELDYLVEAGFTPYEALETGTKNAAEAMNKLVEFGTVTEGKRADLLLVEENPLDDVSNVRNRAGVMVKGRWISEPELQSMLNGLVNSYSPGLLARFWPIIFLGAALFLILRKHI